jgi:DNA-binding GntR family transcriptional regulator
MDAALRRDEHRSDSVYQRLKDALVHYRFRPGEQLHIEGLAQRYGASATPVREALTRLHGEALVRAVPNKGFFVRPLVAEDMRGQYDLALVILRHAIGCADAASGPAIARPPGLGPGPERLARTPDDVLRLRAAALENLYEQVSALAENTYMTRAIRAFNEQTRFVRLLDLEARPGPEAFLRDVDGVVDALNARRRAAAVSLLERQWTRVTARMADLVREGNARAARP